MSCIWLQLNILCTSLVKPLYTENDNSPVIHRSHVTTTLVTFHVLQCTGFHQRGVIRISKRSGVRIVF